MFTLTFLQIYVYNELDNKTSFSKFNFTWDVADMVDLDMCKYGSRVSLHGYGALNLCKLSILWLQSISLSSYLAHPCFSFMQALTY